MVDFEQLIGQVVSITTTDGEKHYGEITGIDDDGWVFMTAYGKTKAIDQMGMMSITLPVGYLGKGVFKREE
jgi:hypothetical protein